MVKTKVKMKAAPNSRLMSALAYVLTWLTGIIVLVISLAKKDKKAAFHGVQAILVGIAMIIIIWILSALLFVVPILGITVINLLWVISFIVGLYLAYRTYIEKEVTIPVLTDWSSSITGNLVK